MLYVTARALAFIFALRTSDARLRLALFSGTLLFFAASVTSASDTDRRITFILSAESAVYEQIASITEQRTTELCHEDGLDCENLAFESHSSDELLQRKHFPPGIKIMLGTRAAKLGSEIFSSDFRLNAMIPLPIHSNQLSKQRGDELNIYIDQPFSRYIDLINLTIPRAGRVGVLVHESNQKIITNLEQIARSKKMRLKSALVGRSQDVGEALSLLLSDIDVLLALPDARIHNSKTISHILTTAYRNNIPVIGFSSAYVKAGAIGAIYTSPDNIAHQLAELIIDIISKRRSIRTPQTASYFSVTFNYEVTRSLGLPTFSTREIKSKILRDEMQ